MNALRVSAALALCATPAGATALGAADVRATAAPAAGNIAVSAPAKWSGPVELERNAWPAYVLRKDIREREIARQYAGPFLFIKPDTGATVPEGGGTVGGVRPFWVQHHDAQGRLRAGYFLYPLFSYTTDGSTYKWSLFELVRRWDRHKDAGAPTSTFDGRGEFEVFPFWFSRQSGDPELSYRALFPIFGTVKNKLGFERLSWVVFPLYVENEKRGAVTTSTPWPIIRRTKGAAHGWGVWPLFNYVERPGVMRHETYLWPLGYNAIRYPSPDDPAGTPPRRDIGALPFYARSTGPGYINEDYVWPFFGYTERHTPKRYSERRYFWPLAVQGRGDERHVNRWAPFYTHSVIKGYDKTWYAWPLVRRAEWTDEGAVARERTQFLYFLYWNETQRVAGRPNAPAARLTHLWPLYSNWDNGAGRRQIQFISPFEVFFPGNEKVRNAWSPLAAVARHEQRAPGDTRTSLLWDAITWEKQAALERKEFHVGPLFSMTEQAEQKRIAVGNGLFGLKRAAAGSGWKFFWFDFAKKPAPISESR